MRKRWPHEFSGSWRAWLLAMLCSSAIAPMAAAQDTLAVQRLQRAFAEGDADGVLSRVGDRVELALLGHSRLHSRAQATFLLREFFRSHPPESFTMRYSVQEEGGWFATGQYAVRRADYALGVYLRLRQRRGEWELVAVRVLRR